MVYEFMTINGDDETQSLLEIYLRSRASDFSKFFNGLTAYILQFISTNKITRRSASKSLAALKNRNFSLVLSITLVLSLATGLSMMGFLRNREPISPLLDIQVHSGLWDRIPIHESTNKTYKVENPTEHPLTLELKTLNWSPIISSKDVKVTWDYDGTPLLPGEAVYIRIDLENVGLSGTIIVSLDIHIIAVKN